MEAFETVELSTDLLNEGKRFDRIIMNHPSNYYEFFDSANRILNPGGIVHLYVFISEDDIQQLLVQITTDFPSYQVIDTYKVRQSSPSEYHMCVSLKKIKAN